MKKLLLFPLSIFIAYSSFSQNGDKELKTQLEKKVTAYRKTIESDEYTMREEVEFSVDTFRIEEKSRLAQEMDYSTVGIQQSIGEMTDAYDKLMNKYYNLLLNLLKGEDKQTLVTAQRTWLNFRKAESGLINTMSKEKYSGGGTAQGLVAGSRYADLLKTRTTQLFEYYYGIISKAAN